MSTPAPRSDLLVLLMRAASALSERINAGVVGAGFAGLRPAHGLVLLRISGTGATVSEVAAFLGVRKQSAAQTVTELEEMDLVERKPHPHDGRAQLLSLTPRGEQVTQAATTAAVAEWNQAVQQFDEATMQSVAAALQFLGAAGSLHPVW
jgi:DNA-binding MarR family transcriptional regulator